MPVSIIMLSFATMKTKTGFILLLLFCIALGVNATDKDRPTGLRNILLREGDMEYSMQGLVIDVPVPKNHNNDYLSIAIYKDYYDEINNSNNYNISQTESKIIYYPTLYVRNKLLNIETPIDLDEIINKSKVLNVEKPNIDDCYIWYVATYEDFIFFIAKTYGQWFTLFFDTISYDVDCISQSLMRKGLSGDNMWIITYQNEDISNSEELSRESLGELYDFIKNVREKQSIKDSHQ